MDQDIIKKVTTFGMALVERQHKFFLEESVDNLEHIPAVKRIADTAYQYLTANGVNSEVGATVKKELINHGRELFIKLWIRDMIEDGETPDTKDEKEAKRTFDKLLKTLKTGRD